MVAETAIGAGVSLASSIIGAIGSANSAKNASNTLDRQHLETQKMLGSMKKSNKAWYDQKMNEDYTMRSDSQAILKKQRELLDEQYKKSRAVNTVMGGSDESLSAQQAAANESIASTATNIAGQSQLSKDNADQQYRQQDMALDQQALAADQQYATQKAGIYQQQANNIAQAAGQGVQAGLGLIGSGINQKKA